MNLKWSYGVTTVPERRETYLPLTLDSLANAGFDKPRLFVDDSEPLLGILGTWTLAAMELYLREPKADRYAIFQDDIVMCTGTRNYLNGCHYMDGAYYNLFTYAENEPFIEGKDTGWHLSNQRGRGALALVFDRDVLTTLFIQDQFILRSCHAHKGKRSVDGAISDGMRGAKYKEYIHNPSLVQHIGDISTKGRTYPEAKTFPGQSFNPNIAFSHDVGATE
jgi:hypothetical protein